MRIEIPVRTESEANVHDSWRARWRRARSQRGAAYFMLRGSALETALPCAVLLTRIAPRALDDDNLRGALKAVRDGIADWLGTDDADPRVFWVYGQRRGGAGVYAVSVEIVVQR